ncbi:MAG: hypothetical protein WCR01_11105 [Bacteroidota bacterium]
MELDKNPDEESRQNYLTLKENLNLGLAQVPHAKDLRQAKGILIEIQNQFKGLKLRREDREELYNRLQHAFAEINAKIEDEKFEFEFEAAANYADLKAAVAKALSLANTSHEFRETWDFMIDLQNRIKAAKLVREQREELFLRLQDAFTTVKTSRDEERLVFEKEAHQNYLRLKALVDKGLIQAEETHEYKDTREFLKKIQSEFKGIKMAHEQREELYSRLQTAFDILGKRLDDFFRHKKKNWEVKMQYKLSQYSVDIFELNEALKKEQANLSALEDQLEVIVSSGKESPVKIGLQARIASAYRSIERKQQEIIRFESERSELQSRLDQPEEKDAI